MNEDYQGPTKKRRHDGCGSGAGHSENHGNTATGGGGHLSSGFGFLPSKEAMASKGLEAKVDMATHGHKSWALTSLGAWRDQSLSSSGEATSAEFVKSRQREARRAMLGGAAAAAAAATAAAAPAALTTTEGGIGAGLSGADGMAEG